MTQTTTSLDLEMAARAQEMKYNERAMENMLREYILNTPRKFHYGGVCNLASTISSVLEELAIETECDDYRIASSLFEAIESAADLKYIHA